MTEDGQLKLSATINQLLALMKKRLPAQVTAMAGLKDIIAAFSQAPHARLVYVLDDKKHLMGAISLGNVSKHLFFHHNSRPIDNLHLMSMASSEHAKDFIDRPVISAGQNETIESMLRRMVSANIKEIPVLDEQGSLVGDVTLVDILFCCGEDFLS